MNAIPPIKAVMTPFPYSIDRAEPLDRAREMMERHDFRHLPVKDGARLVGVITDRDLRLIFEPRLGLPAELTAGDVAHEAYVVDLNERLDNVLLLMAERHIGSALVVKEGRLAGIFTHTDACRRFGEFLRERFLEAGGDDAA